MTPQELEKLIVDHPVLYHLTWRGAWSSILEHGLLSTNALLDRSTKSNNEKSAIGCRHRSKCVSVEGEESDMPPLRAMVRDQSTLIDDKLKEYLRVIGMSAEDWYRRQNARVFFFLKKEPPQGGRERGFVALAKKYEQQDVIIVCTKSLINAHFHKIDLSHYNSGFNVTAAKAPEVSDAYRRHDSLFLRIENYTYKRDNRKNHVNELTVVGGVPDIRDHVIKIVEMNHGKEGKVVYPSGSGRSFL